MESPTEFEARLEIRRRLTKTNNAKRCLICGNLNFRATVIAGINATVCNVCGHIDFFMELADANPHTGS